MKTKLLLTAALLAASSFAMASGGLSIHNVEQHMVDTDYVSTNTDRAKLSVPGNTEKFDVTAPSSDQYIIDTNQLKQSYDSTS